MAIIWPILEKLFEVKKKYLTKAATKRLVNKSNKIESEKVAAAGKSILLKQQQKSSYT